MSLIRQLDIYSHVFTLPTVGGWVRTTNQTRLTGEWLSTVNGLPVTARLSYPELRRALVDRLGLTKVGQRQCFRGI